MLKLKGAEVRRLFILYMQNEKLFYLVLPLSESSLALMTFQNLFHKLA